MSETGYRHKNINIREDQEEWLEDSSLNLSKFIREKLDERIEMEKSLKSEQKEANQVTS